MTEKKLSVVGGTLFVDSATIEIFRDNRVLDLRIKDLDPENVEVVEVHLGQTLIASLAAQLGTP